MAAPMDTTATMQQRPRRNKKSNAPGKHQAQSSINNLTQTYLSNSDASYNEDSADQLPPMQTSRPRKHSNAQGHPRSQNTPNGAKHKGQRASSQPQNIPLATESTPVKAAAAYAGPTFHASPAASSLPIPKMFSKSVPNTKINPPVKPLTENPSVVPSSGEGEQAPQSYTPDPKAREPSPLDFLFDAARQARRNSSQAATPTQRSGALTPSEELTPTHSRRTPATQPTSMFPFELDGSNEAVNHIGPAFATPYQERMKAYQPRDINTNASENSLDENERLAKTEALKRLLGRPPSMSPSRSPVPEVGRPQAQRHKSGPSLTSPSPSAPYSPNYHPMYAPNHGHHTDSPFRDIPRPPSSKLRQQVSPSFTALPSDDALPQVQSPSRAPKTIDPRKLEDDLRRVLKLDGNM